MKLIDGIAGVAIVSVILGVSLTASKTFQSSTAKLDNKIRANSVNMMEREYTKYTGLSIKGNQVINAARELKEQIEILVFYNDGKVLVFDSTSPSIINLPSDPNYVNPSTEFTGEIERDANDEITRLVFDQK